MLRSFSRDYKLSVAFQSNRRIAQKDILEHNILNYVECRVLDLGASIVAGWNF